MGRRHLYPWLHIALLLAWVAAAFAPTVLPAGCDPLVEQEGVQAKCTAPKDPTLSKAPAVDCHDRYRRLPPGTTASYGCYSPYYRREGAMESNPMMTCSSNGTWTGSADYHQYSCTIQCGIPNLAALSSYIIGGIPTRQADWPWHATIFRRLHSNSDDFQYICGGTLIKPALQGRGSEFVIITASHCLEKKGRRGLPLHRDDVRVVLGSDVPRLNGSALSRSRGRGGGPPQTFEVKEILLHESYDGWHSDFQADIALIRLKEDVRIAPNVLPVCLSKTVGRPAPGSSGHVAGFGVWAPGGAAGSQTLRRATLPVVHSDSCSAWRSSRKLSGQEFCAGTEGGQNACNGDSGGGLVFNGTDGAGHSRYYLQGIVSHGRAVAEGDPNPTGCDTYTVFTKVSTYLDWIHEVLEGGTGGNVSRATVGPRPQVPTTAPAAVSDDDFIQFVTPKPTNPAAVAPAPSGTPERARSVASSSNCGLIQIPESSPKATPFAFRQDIRVVSGRGEWPWQATIFDRSDPDSNNKSFIYSCSGTVIPSGQGGGDRRQLIVLTAASCVTVGDQARVRTKAVGELQVALGLLEPLLEGMSTHSPSAQLFSVSKIVPHPSYNGATASGLTTYDNDLAIIQLGQPIPNSHSNEGVTPACLPTGSTTSSAIYPTLNDAGHVANFRVGRFEGNGPTSAVVSRLTRTSFPVVEPKKCSKALLLHQATKFCAGNSSLVSNACHGRRGGGFVVGRWDTGPQPHGIAAARPRFYVEGVVSRGGKESGISAALACRLGIFTRVSAYVDWIEMVVAQLSSQSP